MVDQLAMQIRGVEATRREIHGRVAPYDETSYLVGDPGGERLARGCFAKSIRQRETRIPLVLHHDLTRAVGMSRSWQDTTAGLDAVFRVRQTVEGDQALEDVHQGYLPALSIGFLPLSRRRGLDGVAEVREARLMEVSLVLIGAYDGARVLATRQARLDALLAPFRNRPPRIDPTPLPARWGGH
jgi:HK97 family phage prohead protease